MRKLINTVKKTPSYFLKISIPVLFSVIFLFPLFYYLVLIWGTGIAVHVHSFFKVKDINVIEFVAKKPQSWASYNEISKAAIWAIIVSEDWAFYEHNGVDWQQLMIVMKEGAEKFEIKRGASTITQQVVKNLYLTNEKSFLRKFHEIILAYYLESKSTKRWILEEYLNLAEFDKNVFGIKSAAQHYFKKSPASLTFKEGAFLAMLLPSPKKYSVSFHRKKLTAFAHSQVARILGKLVVASIISRDQMSSELNTPFSWEASPELNSWESLDAIIEGVKNGDSVDEGLQNQDLEEPNNENSVPEENPTASLDDEVKTLEPTVENAPEEPISEGN